MEKTNDGFEIAEEDLKMRGPGEFFGTQQSGYGKSLIVNFQEDGAIIRKARQLAFNIVEKDPHLTGSPHQNIRKKFMQKYKSMLDFVNIG
jgi:ATP-dependent DNA helicase RecG